MMDELGAAANVTLLEPPVRPWALRVPSQAALRARRRQYELREHLGQSQRAEEALREHGERLHLVLEASTTGWWDWDVAHNRVAADAQAKALFGLAPEAEVSFNVFLERLDPEQVPQVLAELPEAMESSGDFDSEFHLIWPDGSSHWILARGRAFRDESGQVARLMGLMIDITGRKQAEEALRESEQFYQTLLDTLPVGVVLASPQGVITHISSHARRMFKLAPDQGLGTTPLDWIAPEHHEVVRQRMRRVLIEHSAQSPIEYRMFRLDRTPIWAELASAPFFDSRGRLKGVITVCRDITERIRLMESVEQKAAEAEAANEAKSHFLANTTTSFARR